MIADIAEELRQGLEQAWAKRLQHQRADEALRALIDGYETALEALGEDPQVPSRASVESERPMGAALAEVEPLPIVTAPQLDGAMRKMHRILNGEAPTTAPTPHENAKAWSDLVDNVRKNGKRAASTPTEPTKKRNTKPGRPVRADHAAVADVAREAIRAGRPITSAVADHFGISSTAASQRIAKARAAGHNIPSLVTRKASARPAGATKGSPITVEAAAALIEDGAA
jgi:hypothetical protein